MFFKVIKKIYSRLELGKQFDPKTDKILIAGGSDTFGKQLIKHLINDYNVPVINLDTTNFKNKFDIQKYKYIECRDFTKLDTLYEALDKISNYQGITIFINNLQFGEANHIAHVQKCIRTNVTSVMIIIKNLVNNIMKDDKKSYYIINITKNMTLHEARITNVSNIYIASKSALNQIHDGISSELPYNRFKTLLVYIPELNSDNDYKSTRISKQFVSFLKSGKFGEMHIKY
ncbi:hypothetical protein TBLA_0B05660 [Henningerozyma blattae CBS 6284]|uniref:Uncharacterized protein n=1 Tax=Henningerozyma blattae (strain ATCC 34711 / CBS 6284 / DSM 70876 / NBRC 10599 / NRRL Y-10934 / UCD 77-7) TaxID=1071380 RepID=I2GZ41_HENB6|nr:hypothetical protein TBLA_0B05660 [Tetrapisispora blattae CBS 6284]CCH59393.1 hypothetical protein TBLA_0B05660 [Tetrapisispora blattae CBS 6284]